MKPEKTVKNISSQLGNSIPHLPIGPKRQIIGEKLIGRSKKMVKGTQGCIKHFNKRQKNKSHKDKYCEIHEYLMNKGVFIHVKLSC